MSASERLRSIEARAHDIAGLPVRRAIPTRECRAVGPYVFLDHMGPTAAGEVKINVRPHPHIGLATVTYLFDGEIVHRDSLGSLQTIAPGAVNWMNAGKGIVHSERARTDVPAPSLHGTQFWVALPLGAEESMPSFQHHPAATLPVLSDNGVRMRVLAGEAFGAESPVATLSSLFQVDVQLDAGARLQLPIEYEERALYVAQGVVRVGDELAQVGKMLVFTPRSEVIVEALEGCRLMLFGGAKLDAPRYMDWNFVSSSKERLEQAKSDWRAQRFDKVPGDEQEWIPLP